MSLESGSGASCGPSRGTQSTTVWNCSSGSTMSVPEKSGSPPGVNPITVETGPLPAFVEQAWNASTSGPDDAAPRLLVAVVRTEGAPVAGGLSSE